MSDGNIGPLLTDEEFFQNCLNLYYEGLEDVRENVCKGDYQNARKSFADYIRNSLDPEKILTIPYEEPENVYKFPDETDEEAWKRMEKHVMISVGVPHKFGEENPINWKANPTFNGYKEWTWQLNRHHELKMLAHEYNRSHNSKCAKLAAELFHSWVRQAIYPGDVIGYETECWRTIECGIRMGSNWPYALFTFFRTKEFTDDILVDWYKSVWEHGKRLYQNHTHGNWLVMEMNGLAQIGIIYPQFKQSKMWMEMAFARLVEELDKQIYPDGFQYELSTGYHDVVINNYQRLIEVAKAFHIPVPSSMIEKLENACAINIKLMMPNGLIPDINDGKWLSTKEALQVKERILPGNENIRWITSNGKEGHKPDYESIALPYSGFFVFRNGWERDSTWALFDGAPFGRGHQHEDKLSLLIYSGEKLLLTEGGNYAYDDSEMRKYVLSTRAHNTVRVDGMDQNRRKGYKWEDQDIQKRADLKWSIGKDFDYAESSYKEGYGEGEGVIHNRCVYFVKNPGQGLNPYFIVVDRLISEESHEYEFLWHVDSELINLSTKGVEFKEIDMLMSETKNEIEVVNGREKPEWQGFVATGTEQGMYRPINCISALVKGKRLRIVTVWYPHEKAEKKIKGVKANSNLEDENITLEYTDGTVVICNENYMKSEI